jgi:hypothetical protein
VKWTGFIKMERHTFSLTFGTFTKLLFLLMSGITSFKLITKDLLEMMLEVNWSAPRRGPSGNVPRQNFLSVGFIHDLADMC